MVLYMVGLGLGDEKDITLRGLEAVRSCEKIFFESYTSQLRVSKNDFEEFYSKEVTLADRSLVEENSEKILSTALEEDVAFLVAGDVFGATTHAQLWMEARKKGVEVEVINNASIINSVGKTGLQLYKFGKTLSIPYSEESFTPKKYYNYFLENRRRGLHTLFLLDIKTEEERFMSVAEAVELLLERSREKQTSEKKERKESAGREDLQESFTKETMCVGVARLNSDDEKILYGTAEELKKEDFGPPLHSLIVPGDLQDVEEEMLNFYKN